MEQYGTARKICWGVEFTVTEPGIKEILFKDNDGKTLADKVRVHLDVNGRPTVAEAVDPRTEIKIRASGDTVFTPGRRYYIVALPATLPKG